jgi:RNA polymerase sigma-70 factor, ECF subfamily
VPRYADPVGTLAASPGLTLAGDFVLGKQSGGLSWQYKMKNEIASLLEQASKSESAGAEARGAGDETKAENFFRQAHGFASKAARQISSSNPDRIGVLRVAAQLALRCGEAVQARQWISDALTANPSVKKSEAWMQLSEEKEWPDEWLLAAIRREPPDKAALDALVDRHWNTLFGRCLMLTLSRTNASDLAQSTWCRVLRSRHRLNPGGRFAAYLNTIATNLWRDSLRSAARAGSMAEKRLISLNDSLSGDEESTATLIDTLPDLPAAHELRRRQMAMDIDQALAKLTPLLREVLVARFITGESCAEIGRRHGRAEQTISGWVRTAIQQMKRHLEDPTGEDLKSATSKQSHL